MLCEEAQRPQVDPDCDRAPFACGCVLHGAVGRVSAPGRSEPIRETGLTVVAPIANWATIGNYLNAMGITDTHIDVHVGYPNFARWFCHGLATDASNIKLQPGRSAVCESCGCDCLDGS